MKVKNFAITLIVIASLIGLFYAVTSALDRAERVECYKWQRHSEQFVGFYLTEWQKSQCDYHGIDINAPVR